MESLTTENISSILQNKTLPESEFLNFPCHIQAVERCVKLVPEFAEESADKITEIVLKIFDSKILQKVWFQDNALDW